MFLLGFGCSDDDALRLTEELLFMNHAGFDDAKRIYLIMIVIIKKGKNVNVYLR